jgi:D-3-phosphoglycerate dehydrogenase
LGIPVMITPNANQQSVAEHTVGLMFALAKKTVLLDKRLRQGHWDKAVYNGTELRGKCLCLIGFGRIGRRVAELVKPLEMEVMVFDPYLPEEVEVPGVKIVSNLTELLKVADFVSIHCPCTDETRNLIGIEHFKIMKRTAYIINTARGELIQQDALVYALEQGLIAGAGIDTFAVEPATKNNPLWAFENVVVTPHIAGATKEALRNMGCSAVNNIFRVLEGAEIDPATVINPSVLEVK